MTDGLDGGTRSGGRRAGRTMAALAVVGTLAGVTGCERAGGAAGSPAASVGATSAGAPAAPAENDTPAEGEGTAASGRGPRVVFLGTSLTAGLGVDPDSAYPAVIGRLAERAGTPIRVVNAGQSGETSAGALRRVDWVLREPADVLVLETGANDGLRGQSPDSLRANLQRIVDRVRARQPELPILLVRMEAPPNLGAGYTRRFRAAYDSVAARTGVTLGPFLLEGVAGVAALNQGDAIHPNPEGARKVAATLWPALQPLVTRVGGAGATGAAASAGRPSA